MDGILISVVGTTDPIRGGYDGPILHIVRYYEPRKVYMILSEEIGKLESEYHHNEDAIHLLNKECEVESIMTGLTDVHGYDSFALFLLKICNQIKQENIDEKIYLNVSSGTPQMKTAFCMIAISDPNTYIPIQVDSPEKSANRSLPFEPQTDLIEDWFETDIDNTEDGEKRCVEPQLMNFRRPIIQFEILSLIQNYDYSGAYHLYEENKENFSEEAGLLLRHAVKRLSLENGEAKKIAKRLGLDDVLYPVKQSNVAQLVEFFISMKVKQSRGELNDFAMRVEVLTEYLAIYLLEKCMRVQVADISDVRKLKNSTLYLLSREKCEKKIPGIVEYLDNQFAGTRLGGFDWGKPLSAMSMVHIVNYLSLKPEFERYGQATKELNRWVVLSAEIRNPVAHTIISITEDTFQKSYEKKTSADLVKNMRTVLMQVFGNVVNKDVFEIYDVINQMIKDALEK